MVTDRLGSYAAARRKIMPGVEHRSHKGLNNRAENSHRPIRKPERVMQGFRMGPVAAFRLRIFRHPKPVCSALVKALRAERLPASFHGDG